MDIKSEIRKLEAKGVFISLSYDHYYNKPITTNCNFTIEFIKVKNILKQTEWFGDNHEFGDTADVLEAAIRIAKWLLRGDRLKWYFHNSTNSNTKKGLELYKEYVKNKKRFRKMLVKSFPAYAKFSKSLE